MRYRDIILARALGKGKTGMAVGWPLMLGVAGGGGTETTITGVSPLLLAAALKKPLKSLTQYGLCSQADTPTPSSPVGIMCNNGEVKYGWHDIVTTSQLSGYGTYVSPSTTAGNRAYKWFKDLPNGVYKFAVDGDYEIIVQWRDPADPADGVAQYYENLSGWITSGEVTLDKTTGGYGIAVRRTSGTSITPSNFDGLLHVQERGLYADGTPEVLTVSGKNVYNPARKTDKRYLSTNGTSVYKEGCSFTNAIPVEYGKTYTFSGISSEEGSNNKRLVLYTDTENPPLQTSVVAVTAAAVTGVGVPYSVSITVNDPTAKYIRASFNTNDTNVMMEEGATATDYQPYVAPQTITDIPMLLSVGDYADEAEIISGAVTRNVGVKVFDGTETGWSRDSDAGTFNITMAGVRGTNRAECVCSHFVYKASDLANGNVSTSLVPFVFNLVLIFKATDYASLDAWKAYLAAQYAAGTPVVVLYPLVDAATESVTPQPLETTAGDNTITVEANVSPIQLEAVYMKGETT